MVQTARNAFDDFVSFCRRAIGQQVSGLTEAFQSVWSKSDDVVLIGAAGSHQVGWGDVGAQLTWAAEHLSFTTWSFENLLTALSDDLAFTIDLEHMSDDAGQQRTLRVSQGYRYEDGEWRVVFRHADPMAEGVRPPSS